MVLSHFLLATGWIFYGILHSILAAETVKLYLLTRCGVSNATYRKIYNVIASATLFLLLYLQVKLESIFIFSQNSTSYLVGIFVSVVGLCIMLHAIRKYFHQLSGIDKNHVSDKLEITGMHSYVRHPLYSGTFLLLVGLFLLFPLLSNLIAVIIIIIYTLIGAKLEEQKLLIHFGEAYAQYQQTTPMIIPSLKRLRFNRF